MTHSADQFEKITTCPPPSPTNLLHLRQSSAHAHRCYRSAVSACSAAARSFSPLCFTHSGFNSDSTQYPADRAAPEQVSSSNYSCPPHVPSSAGLPPLYGPGSCPLLLIFRTSLSARCYGACYTCCFMCLCGGVWRRRALQSHTGDGIFLRGKRALQSTL